ncbi:hypothetical protein MPTK1_4g19500 [Marchantia polymorpha subsp. ruderalis]|uniref:EF-hand domain-containing protein n=2 Tax=Marchantia polymorpha TaxID=3197 RepID=A0AAF6BBL6_MARPO|nr:hypothetical protein MARPO_0126s0044 [Marchantia polymorpha]BBN09400.1 hypothetical protein Mp_4g19500 [Marchantia polymorpha subsp. ruderalis]|eukprot:PTQ30342.1 hypothetical protein MARPO_0126s0044 [Marchantia polymorpha]
MKLLSLFGKKVKASDAPRDLNPYAGFLTSDPQSGTAKRHIGTPRANWSLRAAAHQARKTPAQRIERKSHVVDKLFDAEHQQLIEAFKIIDKNGDGKISHQELRAMWATLGEKVTNQELRLMVQEVDVNGDGEIDLGEFIILKSRFGLGSDDVEQRATELRVAFSVADADRDGHISASDLQKLMKRLGKKKVTIAECYVMLQCVDSDGDNLIDFREFEKLMTSAIFSRKF